MAEEFSIALLLEARNEASEALDSVSEQLDGLRETVAGTADSVQESFDSMSEAMTKLLGVTPDDVEAFNAIAESAGLSAESIAAYDKAIEDATISAATAASADEAAAAIARVGEAAGISAGDLEYLTNAAREAAAAQTEASLGADKETEALGGTEAASGSAAAGIGKIGMVAVAAGAVVAGVSVKMAMGYQEATASLQSHADISAKAANKIGNAFLSTAGKSTFSSTQIMEAYSGVAAQLGNVEGHALSAKQAMTVMSTALDMSEASGEDLTTTTQMLSGVMQAYSIRTKDVATVGSQLYQTANITGTSLSSLGQQLSRLHSRLGSLTPPLGQTGALMVDLAEHGQTGRQALRAVSTSMQTLMKSATGTQSAMQHEQAALTALPPSLQAMAKGYLNGSETMAALSVQTQALSPTQAALMSQFESAAQGVQKSKVAYDELGISVMNQKGNFVGMGSVIAQLHQHIKGMTEAQQIAYLTTEFGSRGAQQMLSVIRAGPAAYDKATAAVDKNKAAQKGAAAMQNTVEGQLKILKSSAEDLAVTLGRALIPIVTKVMHDLIKVIGPIAAWIGHNKKLVTTIIEVAGVMFLIVKGAKLVSSAIEGIGTAMKFLEESDIELWPLIAALLIIAGIAYLVIKHWKGVKHVLEEVFNGIKRVAEDVWNWMKEVVADVVRFIKGHWELLLAIFGGPFIALVILVATHFDEIKRFISDAIKDIVGFFETLPGRIMAPFIAIGTFILKTIGTIKSDFSKGIADIIGFFETLPGKILSFLESLPGDFRKLGMKLIDALLDPFKTIGSRMEGVLKGAVKHIPLVGGLLSHLAEGGLVSKPTLALVGEAGPELVVPMSKLPGGEAALASGGGISPLPMMGSSGGSSAPSSTSVPSSASTIYQISQLVVVANNPAQLQQQLAQRSRVSALSSNPMSGPNLSVAS